MTAPVQQKQFLTSPAPVTLVAAARPLATPVAQSVPDVGLTVAEIAARADLPSYFWEGAGRIRVEIIDHRDHLIDTFVVPPQLWHRVKPKSTFDRRAIVVCEAVLEGGGGGGKKNVVQLVAMIAVIAATFAIGAGALAGTQFAGASGFSFAAGTSSAKVLGAAVTIGGALAISALSKPPSAPALNQAASAQDNTAAIQANLLAPGASFPRYPGTFRAILPALCEPLIEHVNDSQIVEVVLGAAGPHSFSRPLFGGHPPPAGTVIKYRRGLSGDALQKLVKRYGHTDTLNQPLTSHKNTGVFVPADKDNNTRLMILAEPKKDVSDLVPQWHSIALRPASSTANGPVDEHWINLTFASLLNSDTVTVPVTVPFRARMRRINNGKPGNWVNWPEFHVVRAYQGQFTVSIRVLWQRRAGLPPRPPRRADGRGGMWAYTSVAGQSIEPKTKKWSAHPYFINRARRKPGKECYSAATYGVSNLKNMVGKSDRWEVYLDPKKFPSARYELQIQRGLAVSTGQWNERKRVAFDVPYQKVNDHTIYHFTGTPDLFGYFKWPNIAQLKGVMDVGSAALLHSENYVSDVAVSSVSAVINKQPSPGRDVATVSIRGRNIGNIGAVSVLASALVNDYNPSTQTWDTLRSTTNPAPHAREIRAGALNPKAVPASLIDDADFVAFRSRCAAKGYQCNLEIKDVSNDDAFALVSYCGFGGARNAEQFGVGYEYDRSGESPVQVFSPRNMNNLRISKSFPDMPDGLRCRYFSAVDDYQTANEIVWLGSTRDRLEERDYPGLVTVSEVRNHAMFDLRHVRNRMAEYRWNASLESIRCRKWSLVGLQSPILTLETATARILSVTLNGGGTQITGLVLDQSVRNRTGVESSGGIVLPQNGIGLTIQRSDGSVSTSSITLAGDGKTVTFTNSIPVTDTIEQGCLVTVGPLGTDYRRVIIRGVEWKDHNSAELVAFDEARAMVAQI